MKYPKFFMFMTFMNNQKNLCMPRGDFFYIPGGHRQRKIFTIWISNLFRISNFEIRYFASLLL
jgi:hypothetical protein